MTTFQRKHGILVATIASYRKLPPSAEWMLESARRNGIEVTLLGQGQPYPCHRIKTRLVADHLREHLAYRHVLQVDLRDVVFCASIREIFHKYLAFGRGVVASAERACWPMPSFKPRSPDLGTSYRYLNAGVIMASRGAWLSAWDLMCAKERAHKGEPPEIGYSGHHIFDCDQAAWSDLYVNGECDIVLDSRSEVFQNMSRSDSLVYPENPDLVFEGRRVVNRETGTRPCLIHCSGFIPMEPLARYVVDPPVAWVRPIIEIIRSEPPAALQDPESVERLLLNVGLHDPDDDPPIGLLPYSGKGLGVRRRPSEFAAMLTWLSIRPPIRSYAEIGVGEGGAFIATAEYLRRFQPLEFSLAVGDGLPPFLLDYVSRERSAHLVRADGAAEGLRELKGRGGKVDLTFIDAYRNGIDPRAEWSVARECSRFVAIQGIADPTPNNGARHLWEEIRSSHGTTHEFIDRRSEPSPGIGLVDMSSNDHR